MIVAVGYGLGHGNWQGQAGTGRAEGNCNLPTGMEVQNVEWRGFAALPLGKYLFPRVLPCSWPFAFFAVFASSYRDPD